MWILRVALDPGRARRTALDHSAVPAPPGFHLEARRNDARHRDLMTSIFERALAPKQMPEFVDNLDWLGTINALDFVRDVGSGAPSICA